MKAARRPFAAVKCITTTAGVDRRLGDEGRRLPTFAALTITVTLHFRRFNYLSGITQRRDSAVFRYGKRPIRSRIHQPAH